MLECPNVSRTTPMQTMFILIVIFNGATHMPVIFGVRQRPPTENIQDRVAQRRKSPSAGDHSQLRHTPRCQGYIYYEVTAEGSIKRYLLRLAIFTAAIFYCTLWITRARQLRGTFLCNLSARGSRSFCRQSFNSVRLQEWS